MGLTSHEIRVQTAFGYKATGKDCHFGFLVISLSEGFFSPFFPPGNSVPVYRSKTFIVTVVGLLAAMALAVSYFVFRLRRVKQRVSGNPTGMKMGNITAAFDNKTVEDD